ncbi:MAG: phosphoribosylamine--glycine ligase [candidate division WOR-3 bacterium]
MKVFIIGSGGREHALAYWFYKFGHEVIGLSGNPGIEGIGKTYSFSLTDFKKIEEIAIKENIDVILPGPEEPIVKGIKDRIKNFFVYSPNEKEALLEGSKAFAKEFMSENSIPTARYEIFDEPEKAYKYIEKIKRACVVKASGLAQGKGSIVCKDEEEAKEAVKKIMEEKIFGDSGNVVVIEDFLKGIECSIITLVAGDEYLMLLPSQDHKPVYDNDKGPNTGGMGAYAPLPFLTNEIIEKIENEIIKKTIRGLIRKNFDYQGVIYAGLMITREGVFVLEYNVRFGDPETQPLAYLINTDPEVIIEKTKEFKLGSLKLKWNDGYALCVVVASGGYPEKYEKGKEIKGLEECENMENLYIFHAGTKKENNKFFTNGGRVLGVLGFGKNLKEAKDRAYDGVNKIYFEGMHYRKDIGDKGFKSLEELL